MRLFTIIIAFCSLSFSVFAAHVDTGNVHAKNGNYAEALASFNAAIAQNPNNARAYKLRGHVYYAMGDYAKALVDLDHVVSLVPGHPNPYADRAIVYSVLGKHGLALADIERALELKPSSSFAQAVREEILQRASQK